MWVSHALAVLPEKVLAAVGRVNGVIGFSDNASHFHGAMFFSHTLLNLAHALRVKLVVWNFFEAGEGKVCLCLVALRAKATLPVTDNCNRARIDRAIVTSSLLSFRGR